MRGFYHTAHRLRRFKRRVVCALARRSGIFSPLVRTVSPLAVKRYECGLGARDLLVFLPGIGDLAEDYEINGFIDAVRRVEISIDMAVADMHFGYYLARTAVERLRHDVIIPARADGYGRVNLAGISLGGFGALYYAAHHPDEVARLFLLAPYLGDAWMIDEIKAAGGLERWDSGKIAEGDYQRKLWRWLKNYLEDKDVLPELYLGYGLQDSFAPANALLAGLLPPERVHTIPGGHNWRTWIGLWRELTCDAAGAFMARD